MCIYGSPPSQIKQIITSGVTVTAENRKTQGVDLLPRPSGEILGASVGDLVTST